MEHTLIPQGLSKDLIAGSHVLVEVLGVSLLGDLAKVLLGVATQLVEGGGLDTLLDGREVEGREGVVAGHPSRGEGTAVISSGGGGCGGGVSSRGRSVTTRGNRGGSGRR